MLIKSKTELKNAIEKDEKANLGKKITAEVKFRKSFPYTACKYLKLLRKSEYACYRRDNGKSFLKKKLLSQKVKVLDRKKNELGLLAGIDIPTGKVEAGVRIAHPNVILNGYVGEGCVFHGNNVLGNKRTGDKTGIPKLGKNVDVGVGAIIIGDVEIADGCVIGAGAVVTKSFLKPETVIVGVPAKAVE